MLPHELLLCGLKSMVFGGNLCESRLNSKIVFSYIQRWGTAFLVRVLTCIRKIENRSRHKPRLEKWKVSDRKTMDLLFQSYCSELILATNPSIERYHNMWVVVFIYIRITIIQRRTAISSSHLGSFFFLRTACSRINVMARQLHEFMETNTFIIYINFTGQWQYSFQSMSIQYSSMLH
jgi:hypothetical protein